MINLNIAIVFLLLSFFAKMLSRRWTNPATIFLILWAIIISLSLTGRENLPKVEWKYYEYIIWGSISFFAGFFLIAARKRENSRSICNSNYVIRYKFLEILALLCILILILSFFKSGRNSTNILDLASTQENLMNMSANTGIFNSIQLLVITPMYTIIDLFSCIGFWQKKRHIILMLENIVIIFERILFSGGRQAIVEFTIFLVISYIYSNNKLRLSIKQKLVTLMSVLIFIIIFIIISSLRTDHLKDSLLLDLTIEPNMFQYWASIVSVSGLYGFGISSLMGFVYTPFYIIKNLGLLSSVPYFIQNIYNINQLTDSKWVPLGDMVNANAYVSVFWNLFLDGRLYGIIFGMFLFGVISTLLYERVSAHNNILNIAYYILTVYCILYTFGDSELSKINICLTIIYVIFCLKKVEDASAKKENPK